VSLCRDGFEASLRAELDEFLIDLGQSRGEILANHTRVIPALASTHTARAFAAGL
jgi:hypothetical protein